MKMDFSFLKKQIFAKTGFWIMLFFVIRLYGITLPPLEVAHNWRQTTVTMVARNFVETDANIFYPRIDIAGEKTGITGMEFPLLNYLIYMVSLIFGYDHWYGRLINLVVSSIGTWYFYLLVKKYFNQQLAFNATIILLSSLWFSYSRKIMPDTFSVSLVLIGLYLGTNYLDRNASKWSLVGSFVLILAGTLSKLPAICLLGGFIPLLLAHQVPANRRLTVFLMLTFSMIPVGLWYFYWVPYLVETYGFWHFFMGKGMLQGFSELIQHWDTSLKNFYEYSLKFIGFGAFLLGLIFAFKKKNYRILMVSLVVFIPFMVVVLKAGQTFSFHSYYMIPFVPIMALLGGYFLTLIEKRWLSVLFLTAILVEGILNQQHDFRIKEKEMPILALETVLDQFSRPNDLILINSGEYPTPMYFAHRKGWVDFNEKIAHPDYRRELESKGLKYIVILQRTFGSPMELPEEIIYQDENYQIYQVGKN